MKLRAVLLPFLCLPLLAAAAEPEVSIGNGPIQAKVYLPDAKDGFYKGGRFDWSGIIHSLTYKGHDYFGPWFQERRADVKDFVYEGDKVVTGPASSIMGPAEEYSPLGYDDAAAGGVFVKLGIGVLRKSEAKPYDHYLSYAMVDPGKWTVTHDKDWVEFKHELNAPNGYGYVYTKRVQLVAGKPQMTLQHSLRNTGKQTIKSAGYDHNFLTLDQKPAGPGYTITTPFDLKTPRPLQGDLASVTGKQIVYQKKLQGEDRVTTPFTGYSANASDYDFRIESKEAGAGMRVTGDKPLSRAMMWSIRTVVSVEPYIDVTVEPGKTMDWKYTYDFYTLAK
ncbi:MAG TPA: hypothetical protein VNH18_27060 [Bryobacteraceae bacterium]|nr:hypothetical protein [Bryobacteraceae bacterium]